MCATLLRACACVRAWVLFSVTTPKFSLPPPPIFSGRKGVLFFLALLFDDALT